ncbi:hypothetical protein [Vibrio sp. D431a]|uniref:hypothetical protein n=1 Tax=Vibrio sp. D431a TaxID=2837388 RepID=UPI00255373BE|nr:hypothetical protein [Vibrio sp. D431a]MDK9793772.1 hypothetical protein [Vibrio sp. D431a]
MAKFNQDDLDAANRFLANRTRIFDRKGASQPTRQKTKKLKELSKQALFMAEYLQENRDCSSWDFSADLAFAKRFCSADLVHLIEDALKPVNAGGLIVHAWEIGWKTPVTDRRLKALRELVAHGHVEASWDGLGDGAMNQFGRSRVRNYALVSMPV